MPIYEYNCTECGAHLEKIQKASDDALTKCEECGGKLEKQWSLSGFQFKGEGWYVTDYAGKKADSGTEKKETSDSTDSSDSASKTKKEKKEKPKKEKAPSAD